MATAVSKRSPVIANKFSQARIDSVGKTFYKGAPERLLAMAGKYLDGA